VTECADDFRFLGYSGLVVLTVSLSESDPKRTLAALAVIPLHKPDTPISSKLSLASELFS